MTIRIAAVCLAASAGLCLAQDGQQPDPSNDVFAEIAEHYGKLQGCSVTLGMEMSSDEPAFAQLLASMGQRNPGYAVKPNLFAFWSDNEATDPTTGVGPPPAPTLYSDGQEFIAAVPPLGVYTEVEAPETFNAMLESMESGEDAPWQMLAGSSFVFALLSEDPKASLETFLGPLQYKGEETEEGEAYHVFTAAQGGPAGQKVNLALRFQAEGEPWLASVTPDLSESGGPPGLKVVMTFNGWEPTAEAPAEGKITPDPSWKKVDNLAQAIAQAANPQSQGDAGPKAGDPAPEFTLPLLGSEDEFSLAAHKGKVVMLDFWATWCGPCVRALPTVTSVTSEYAAKGVVFAGINLQEDPEHVATFMDNKDWDFTTPLDSGEVADKYGVTGIPHSVIIDKKGVIRYVHVGFGGPEEYEKQLRAEFDELLAE